MESWSYFPDGKGVFFANETYTPTDSFAKSRKFMGGWDQKPSDDMEDEDLLLEFADRGFFDMAKKPSDSKSDEFNAESTRSLTSSWLIASNLLSEQKDSSSRFSSLPRQESSSVDSKFMRPIDYRNSQNDDYSDGKPVIASALPAKKSRVVSSCSQKPLCQVYGCKKDLSSSKDYHKRHRVCEAHSKTAKVIVNGVEQRFCQQCSRFHLLAEFDDGKRSCRRRLAGHNERRRKPSFYFLAGRRHKIPHSSQGNKFLDASFVLPEAYPGSFLYRVGDEQEDHKSKVMKFEEYSTCCPQTPVFSANGNGSDRSCPGFSSEADVLSSIQELNCVSHSNRALSLLSSKSQHVSETPNATFAITQTNGNIGSKKDLIPEGVRSSRVTPLHQHQIESLSINSGKTATFFRKQVFLNPGSRFTQEKGPSTVDLFQLSSHLQRVEQQRNSIQVKQECNEPRSFGGN